MGKKACTRCVFDEKVKGIEFGPEGVCNYCRLQEKFAKTPPDEEYLRRLLDSIRKRTHRSRHGCIVPFSGGVDSTYVLYYLVQEGLRPIAVHSDNGWVTELSKRNMERAVRKLNVPLVKLTAEKDTLRRAYLAFLEASVPEVCLPCEVKNISEIMEFAVMKGIRYLFYGFSPRTEGINPLSWHYIDARYYRSIISRFAGRGDKAHKLNKLGIPKLFYYLVLKGIRQIQLPAFIEWDEEKIKKTLSSELGWVDGGRHSDCSYYPFVKSLLREKFGIDREKTFYCAMINSGEIDRKEAARRLERKKEEDASSFFPEVSSRLGVQEEDLRRFMKRPARYFWDYPTYYPLLKKLKPLVWLASRTNMIPKTFHEKLFRT
ncbi:MAG: hypothetical protein GF409_00645 [Candidatus Omnitrophica bacterium]|nr:hypothetical protein [Candidatus Omnitrophota bacterium]